MDPETCPRVSPHALLLTLPAQGHVAPLMKLAHRLVDFGIKVTFFTTEDSHCRLLRALPKHINGQTVQLRPLLRIVSFPDGLEGSEDDRKFNGRVLENIAKVMLTQVEDFLNKSNRPETGSDEKITFVVADVVVVWALGIAKNMGIKGAAFFPSVPGVLAMMLKTSELIETGIIDSEGVAKKDEEILLSPYQPPLKKADHVWNFSGNKIMEKIGFEYIQSSEQHIKTADWVLCNWFHELDPSAQDLHPNMLSIGPLLSNDEHCGNYWSQDSTSLTWLDKQDPESVIYLSFGSTTKFNQKQIEELSFALETLRKPFLWVVRAGLTDVAGKYPDGFQERVADFGKIIEWVPQEKVLGHPSIACFVTHCGWNSIIECINMGVPMICWPYSGDHFYGRTCVCYGWRTGLELEKNEEDGIVTRDEIKRKVEDLVSNDGIKSNALKLKRLAQKSVSKGGSSSNNLEKFAAHLML